jgi:uncharacterized protein
MPIGAALYLLCLVPWLQQPPLPPATNSAPSEPVRRLMDLLPPNSMWRNMMEHGAEGDGVRQPWMDEMRKQGIKLADLTFEFDWVQGGTELKNWRLASAEYFTSYDSLGTGAVEPLTNPDRLKVIRASGLEADLEAVGLARAKHGIWVEDPGHQHPPRETGTGYKQVFLAENEWLPVQMFPWFGQYEGGTTPLMRAAMLGDVASINALLARGAPVNAVSPGGWTALGWASAMGGPAAIKALIQGGATVNLKSDGGGDALVAAVANNRPENVEVLLASGADPNSQDARGLTVLQIAVDHSYAEIAKLLRRAGARE